jgi:hypothetical protein
MKKQHPIQKVNQVQTERVGKLNTIPCHSGNSATVNEVSNSTQFTTTPVTANTTTATTILPEFGRWQDVQRLFGIKRGTLYNLMAEGAVKSVSIRRKGNIHGCRLFYLPGIREYLSSLLEDQNQGGN